LISFSNKIRFLNVVLIFHNCFDDSFMTDWWFEIHYWGECTLTQLIRLTYFSVVHEECFAHKGGIPYETCLTLFTTFQIFEYFDCVYVFYGSIYIKNTERARNDNARFLQPHRPRGAEGGGRHKKRVRQPHNTRERQRQIAEGHGEYIMPEANPYRSPKVKREPFSYELFYIW
jgi:hypothetical protein